MSLEVLNLAMESSKNSPDSQLVQGSIVLLLLMTLGGVRRQVISQMSVTALQFDQQQNLFIYTIPHEKTRRATGKTLILPPQLTTILQWYLDKFWPTLIKNRETKSLFVRQNGGPGNGMFITNLTKETVSKLMPRKKMTPLDFRRNMATLAVLSLGKDADDLRTNPVLFRIARLMNTSTTILLKHYVRQIPTQAHLKTMEEIHLNVLASPQSLKITGEPSQLVIDDSASTADSIEDEEIDLNFLKTLLFRSSSSSRTSHKSPRYSILHLQRKNRRNLNPKNYTK